MTTLDIKRINTLPGPAFSLLGSIVSTRTGARISSTVFPWQPGELGRGQRGLGFREQNLKIH